MLSPEASRPSGEEGRRTLLRRLRCKRGSAACAMELMPRDDFAPGLVTSQVPGGVELRVAGFALGLWTSDRLSLARMASAPVLRSTAGEEFWAILGLARESGGLESPSSCRGIAGHIAPLARVERALQLSRPAARPRHPLRPGNRTALFRTKRSARCGRHELASRANWRRTATTTTGMPGYATPRWRSRRCPCWETSIAPNGI